jgi:hypothetical protein
MNLDGDRALERVVAEYDVSFDHKQERADVIAFDRCNGKEVAHKLVRTGKRLSVSEIYGPRALGRPAVLFAVGYGGRTGVARVTGLRLRAGQTCPSPYTFFAYSTSSPPKPPPAGLLVRDFDLVPRNDSRRYPGPELQLTEFYGRSTGDTVAKRLTYFRYRSGRYVAYRSRLSAA